MKRPIVLAIVSVLFLSAGVTIGYSIPRSQPGQTHQATAKELMKMAPHMGLFMGADLKPVETTFNDWLYPDSNNEGSGKSMSGAVNGKPFEFQVRSTMRTKDSFETVIKHYSDKLRTILPFKDNEAWSISPDESGSAVVNGVLVTFKMNKPHQARPVQVGFVGMQAKNCHLHFCITRGDSEEQTYITVLLSKWHVDAVPSD